MKMVMVLMKVASYYNPYHLLSIVFLLWFYSYLISRGKGSHSPNPFLLFSWERCISFHYSVGKDVKYFLKKLGALDLICLKIYGVICLIKKSEFHRTSLLLRVLEFRKEWSVCNRETEADVDKGSSCEWVNIGLHSLLGKL